MEEKNKEKNNKRSLVHAAVCLRVHSSNSAAAAAAVSCFRLRLAGGREESRYNSSKS